MVIVYSTETILCGVFLLSCLSLYSVTIQPPDFAVLFVCTTTTPSQLWDFTSKQVSNNNLTFSGGSTVFTYDNKVDVAMLRPSMGAESGGSDVVFVGDHFLNTTAIACKFGSSAVPAKFISDKVIHCTSPPNPAGVVSAEVTSNGVDFSLSGKAFTYYPGARVGSIWPALGPASKGGTVVTIRGTGFENTSELSCAFGDVAGIETTWLASTVLLCKSPPHRPGLVSVRVSNNGVDFSSDTLNFLYVNDATVGDFKPKQILETGQVPVFVRGSNFMNTTELACRFGSVVVRGSFYTPELLACMAPSHAAQSRLQRAVGRFSVEVSVNGLDYTESGKSVVYSKDSPPGHYAREWMSVAAPNGTFSAGEGSLNFTMCDPGSFQPSSEAVRCLPCPVGFICPGKPPLHMVDSFRYR